MQRNLRPPPRVMLPKPPAHLFEPNEAPSHHFERNDYSQAPTPVSISVPQEVSNTPINYPVNDPDFDAAVRDEMERLEASIQAELQLMSELKGTGGATDLSRSQEFLALSKGVQNYENTPRDYYADSQPEPPRQIQPSHNNPNQAVNLKAYKQEGYPSEYAYAQAMGALEIKSKTPQPQPQSVQQQQYSNQANTSPNHNNSSVSTTRDAQIAMKLASPARRKGGGGGGLSSLYGASDYEASKQRQSEYALQLQQQVEQRHAMDQRSGPAHEEQQPFYLQAPKPAPAPTYAPCPTNPPLRNGQIIEQRPGPGYDPRFPPPSSSLLEEMYGGTGGMVFGVAPDDAKAQKRAKQEEYRRQLDESRPQEGAAGTGRSEGQRMQEQYAYSQLQQQYQQPMPSQTQPHAQLYEPPLSPSHHNAEKAAKRKQQADYKIFLDAQVAAATIAKQAGKLRDKQDDLALLADESVRGPGQAGQTARDVNKHPNPVLNTTIDMFGSSRSPSMRTTQPMQGGQMQGGQMQGGMDDRHSEIGRQNQGGGGHNAESQYSNPDYPNPSSYYPNPSYDEYNPDLDGTGNNSGAYNSSSAGPPPNPLDINLTQARQRLISDVYGSAKMIGHNPAPTHDSWKPSGKNQDERKKAAMLDQRQALQQQMEESKRRKEEEKWRLKQVDEEEERRVRAELSGAVKEVYRVGGAGAGSTGKGGTGVGGTGMGGTGMGSGAPPVANTPPRPRAKPLSEVSPTRMLAAAAPADSPPRREHGSNSNPRGGGKFPSPPSHASPVQQGQNGGADIQGDYDASHRHQYPQYPQQHQQYPQYPRYPPYQPQPQPQFQPQHPQYPQYPETYPSTHPGYPQPYLSHNPLSYPYPNPLSMQPRPSTADQVDNFLLNWQRQVHGPSGNIHTMQMGGGGMNIVHPMGGMGAQGRAVAPAPLDHSVGDVSFVSDSRLLPAHPYQAQGLLSILGGESVYNNRSDARQQGGSVSGLQDILTSSLENVQSSFTLPADRGRVQSQHMMSIGHAAADLEASMNSDSLLMYIGSARAAATPNHAHTPRSTVNNNSSLSPLSKLMNEQASIAPRPVSRPNTGGKTGSSGGRAPASPDALQHLVGQSSGRGSAEGLFKDEDEDEIVIVPDRGAGGARGMNDSFSVHKVPSDHYDDTFEDDGTAGYSRSSMERPSSGGWKTNSMEQKQLTELLRGKGGLTEL